MTFDVLLFDPPWAFDNKVTGGSMTSGAAQKYPTMPLQQVHQLPVAAVSHHASVLFLWVPTTLKFSHGWTTAHAWGFQHYITTIYWEKTKIGMGFWFRNVMEELLVFSRASGAVEPFRCQRPNKLKLASRQHSEKPEEFRRLIENATAKMPRPRRLEGFAQQVVEGWTGCGYRVTKRDIRADLRLLAARTEGEGAWPQ